MPLCVAGGSAPLWELPTEAENEAICRDQPTLLVFPDGLRKPHRSIALFCRTLRWDVRGGRGKPYRLRHVSLRWTEKPRAHHAWVDGRCLASAPPYDRAGIRGSALANEKDGAPLGALHEVGNGSIPDDAWRSFSSSRMHSPSSAAVSSDRDRQHGKATGLSPPR